MTKTLLATVAIAALALSACAKEEKMMKDEPAATAPAAAEPVATEPVEEVMIKEESSGGDAMMDLCTSKGGSVGEWPGEGGATKTCRAADGSEYPLASLSSYEAFQ